MIQQYKRHQERSPKGSRRNLNKESKELTSLQQRKKVTGHNRVMHCSRCGFPKHNASKCPNPGVPCQPHPPRKHKTTISHDKVAVDPDEGPSQTQQTQT